MKTVKQSCRDFVLLCRQATGISGPKYWICHSTKRIGIWKMEHGVMSVVFDKPSREVLEMGLDKACEWLETEYAIHLMKE